jgi:hypothetical protein
LDSSLSHSYVSVEVRGPDNKFYSVKNLKQGRGVFVPQKVGMHEIVVKYEGQEVVSGHYFRVLPQLVEVAPPGMAPCALGSLVQVLVNATGWEVSCVASSFKTCKCRCPQTRGHLGDGVQPHRKASQLPPQDDRRYQQCYLQAG